MNSVLEPTSIDDVVAAVRSTDRLLPVGARTKPRLGATAATLLSTRRLAGIVEYQPAEYTLTARAGTPLSEIAVALAAKGQYLPFDPPLAAAGATLGGTVAANLAGPGRFRYGGGRDFLIGIKLVDGTGQLLTGGGKVVKNAAGFDLPKLVVGSLGRLGVLTELTFKVFPRPPATLTRCLRCASHAEALARLAQLATSRFEADALEYTPADKALYVRLGGPAESNAALAAELGGESVDEAGFWPARADFAWAPADRALVKIPTSPRSGFALADALEDADAHTLQLSAGGATAYVATADPRALDRLLQTHDLSGLVLRGDTASLWLGTVPQRTIDAHLRKVFDPHARFPSLTAES